MPRRFLVQVEEDLENTVSPRHNDPPTSPVTAPSSVSTLSSDRSVQPTRRRGVVVDVEPEDYVAQRQAQIEEMIRQERLQEAQEPARIQVKRTGEPPPPPVETSSNTSLEKKFLSNQKLRKIESFYQEQTEIRTPPPPPWPTRLRQSIQAHQGRITVLMVVLLLVLGTWLTYLGVKHDLQFTAQQTEALIKDLENGRFTSAQERLMVVAGKEKQYKSLYQFGRPLVLITQGEEKTEHLDRVFSLADRGIELTTDGLNLMNDVELGYKQFVGAQEGNSLETIGRLSGQLEGLYSELSSFQAELEQLDNPYQNETIAQMRKKALAQLPRVRRYTLAAQKISVTLPQILAEKGEKRYLVLLQNNAELRPTGGFIGSFALVTIRDGKLAEFKVEDVYEADGQLQGYVTPPEEIVQYLGEAQWYLRDVNWSPDFPKVAQRAQWFLDKTLNVEVDGVVGINLAVVQKLLAVTGPLELVDYDEIITQDNLYERAEAHTELNFFPGSTQKKDFLSAIAQALLDKVFYQETNKVQLARALLESAEEAELLMSLDDPQAEEVLTTLGWTGAVLTPNCPTPFGHSNCVVDTVMQVEANVGVNKANQYLEREITHTVELAENMAQHTRAITWTNTAESEAWPAGNYRVYLRLLVPEGSVLRNATLDGEPLDLTTFKVVQEDGKEVMGYFLEVPIRSSRTLEVFYETPLPSGYTAYALFEQKQSGVREEPVQHIITVGNRRAVTVAPEPEKIDGTDIYFDSEHNEHAFMAVELQ